MNPTARAVAELLAAMKTATRAEVSAALHIVKANAADPAADSEERALSRAIAKLLNAQLRRY